MKRVRVLRCHVQGETINPEDNVWVESGLESDELGELRKVGVLENLEHGSYAIATFVEDGIGIAAPEVSIKNVVTRGRTFITRTRKTESEE